MQPLVKIICIVSFKIGGLRFWWRTQFLQMKKTPYFLIGVKIITVSNFILPVYSQALKKRKEGSSTESRDSLPLLFVVEQKGVNRQFMLLT